MHALKIRPVGSSSGVLLSKEVLAELGVKQGDTIYLTRGPEGSMRVTAHNDNFGQQMQAAEDILRSHRDVFRALSKR